MSKTIILVVEDHEPLRAAIQQVLEAADYAVLTATDGVEALAAMEKTRPDLIVADIMMPRMNGFVFYEKVRARQEWVPIPFIFLTAKAEKADMLKGKKLGAEDYITKPFDPNDLLVAIEARLSRAQAIRGATEKEFEQLKHQIITMLSHELRTPLTYIQGYTSLALEDVPSLSPAELEEFLGAIKSGADRLTRLVEDILVLVRLDTGQAEDEFDTLAEKSLNINGIVERIIRQHRAQAQAQDIALETRLSPDLPAVRLCEPFLADTLKRLLDNAIKFSQGKGERVLVSSQVSEGRVEIAVQDKGVGIATEAIPRLFERFHQIDRELMEQQGSGLGLAIAHELTQIQGGEILVDTKLGEGSTFTIRFPAVE